MMKLAVLILCQLFYLSLCDDVGEAGGILSAPPKLAGEIGKDIGDLFQSQAHQAGEIASQIVQGGSDLVGDYGKTAGDIAKKIGDVWGKITQEATNFAGRKK